MKPRRWICFCLASTTTLFPVCGGGAEELFQAEIRSVEGGVEIGTNASEGYYLLLYRAITMEGGFAPYRMAESEFTEPVESEATYFMVERMASGAPGDWDGDLIDDLFEIRHPPMNPLIDDAADNYDTDSYTNLEEYGLGTHPGMGDTDGDGFGDDDEITDGSDPLDVGSRPVDPNWRVASAEGLVSARNSTEPPAFAWSVAEAQAVPSALVNSTAPPDAFSVVETAEAPAASMVNTAPSGDGNAHPAFAEAFPASVSNAAPPGNANAHPAFAEAQPVSVENTF